MFNTRPFHSTYSTFPIIVKFYQQVRIVKRSKVAKFGNDIISIDGVATLKVTDMASKFDNIIFSEIPSFLDVVYL